MVGTYVWSGRGGIGKADADQGNLGMNGGGGGSLYVAGWLCVASLYVFPPLLNGFGGPTVFARPGSNSCVVFALFEYPKPSCVLRGQTPPPMLIWSLGG
jgi:hypothetical protein